MAIEVKCSTCGAVFGVGDLRAGTQVGCPTCGATLEVRPPVAPEPAYPEPPPEPPPSRAPAWDSYVDEPDLAEDDLPPIRRIVRSPRRSGMAIGLGIASFALGSIALPLSGMCCIGYFTLPISITGLILGLIGVSVSLAETQRPDAMAVSGSVVSLLALLMPFLAPYLFVGLMQLLGH